MTNFEVLVLCVVAVCVAGFVVVCWKLTNAVIALTKNTLRENGRERLDNDRLLMQFMEKVGADREQHERIADLHAQETFRKWKLSEHTEQIGEAAKHGVAQKIGNPPSRKEEVGVGPNETDGYQ